MTPKKISFSVIFIYIFSFWTVVSAIDANQYSVKNPNVEEERLLSTMIGVQGLVYCRSRNKHNPLEGAVARINCEGVDEYGYETESMSILSSATDKKGYFLATLSPREVKDYNRRRFRNCKAFLELSPSEECDVPIDVNNGLSGAPIGSFNRLRDKNIKLFTVGPFFFVPQQEAHSFPDGY